MSVCVLCALLGSPGRREKREEPQTRLLGAKKMVFEGRRMTRWSRADLGNQKEEPGLCSYSPVWSHPENTGEESVCVQAHPSPTSRSVSIHHGRFPVSVSHFGTAERNAHRVADVTGRACRGGRPQSMHLGRLQPAGLRGRCGKPRVCQSDGCSGSSGPADAAAAWGRGCCRLGDGW